MKKITSHQLSTPRKCSDLITAIAISIQAIDSATWTTDDRAKAVRTIAAYYNMRLAE